MIEGLALARCSTVQLQAVSVSAKCLLLKVYGMDILKSCFRNACQLLAACVPANTLYEYSSDVVQCCHVQNNTGPDADVLLLSKL